MYYKYRDLNSFKYFADIIIKSRLYAAPYFDLNDPMEGQYLFSNSDNFNQDMKDLLKGSKDKTRICSLSLDPDNQLMWAHYANGHRGVVIEVEVDLGKYQVREIIYDGPVRLNSIQPHSAIEVLSHKLEAWSYEKEVRVFITKGYYVDVEIKKVICGSRMSNPDYSLVSDLIKAIDPEIKIFRN